MCDKSEYEYLEYLYQEYLEERLWEKKFSDEDINILRKLSFDEDEYIRDTVAIVLINSEDGKGEDILLSLSRDKDSLVRTNACDSLCISESIETYEYLKKVVKKDKNGIVRGYAIASLGDIAFRVNKNKDLLEFLKEVLLSEKVVFAKINLYQVMYGLGCERYLNELISMLNTKVYTNRCATVNCLNEIVNQYNKGIIVEALMERKQIETAYSVSSTIDTVLKEIEEMEFE